MKLRLQIDLGEGPIEVETNLATIVAWERKYKRKASQMGEGMGVEDLAFLAHEACKQNQIIVPLVLDDFIKRLESLDVITETRTNPTSGSPTVDV